MIVNINDIKFYGEFYPNNPEHLWYFCLNDYQVYNMEDLIENYSFKDRNEIEQSNMYVELFKTNIVDLQKKFIELNNFQNNKKFRTILLEETEYSVAFGRFIDYFHYEMWPSWYAFIEEHLINDAIEWCRKNNIPYIVK